MTEMTQPIGYIDSGVGGLTVVREAMRQLPHESVVYLGDTARCPYGPRPAEQVITYTFEMANFLMSKGIKMLVIACNTATAVALEQVRAALPIPVVGVIIPGSRAAIRATKNDCVGIIGTEGTVKSAAYQKTIQLKAPKVKVTSLAAPKFVPLVESNATNLPIAKKVVAETLSYFEKHPVDTLIMGCTHYPLLRPLIQNVMGSGVTLIDSGAETVSEVSMLLDYFNIANNQHDTPVTHHFYTTGAVAPFKEIASNWLPLAQLNVETINLGANK